MTQFVDFVALGWVEENLREAVEAASAGLHRYQRKPDEQQHLLDAQRSIHSATGVLRLCALEPAALLSDEIEQVMGLLHEGVISGDARKLAMTELVAGIEAIPAYLANVRAKREVTPGSIASVVNDLRQFGNRPPLPDSLFFNPVLPGNACITPTDAVATEVSAKDFAKTATRVCHECSQAALKGDTAALERLQSMGQEAIVRLAGTELEPYFKCYTALLELIASGHLKPDEVVLDIFKHCFTTLKNLSKEGYPALPESKLDTYIKRILYYIGKQAQPSTVHQTLLDAFGITDVDSYTACNEGRMIQEDDLLDALEQTMQQLKTVMAFLASSGQEISSANSELVERVVPSLQQVSLHLHVVGLPELASIVNEQYKVLRSFTQQPEAASQSDLIDFGGAMSAVRDQLEFKLQHGLYAEGDAVALDLDTALTEQVIRCLRDMKDHISHEFVRRDLEQLAATAPEALDISIGGLRPIFRAARIAGETDLLNAAEHWDETRFPAGDTLLLIAAKLMAKINDDDFVGSARSDLDQVLSVLGMLEDKQREHDVLCKCAHYLGTAVELGGLINDESMECFAESVAALEQYMESRIADPQGNPEQHLRRAESRALDLETYIARRTNRASPDSNVLEFSSHMATAPDTLQVELADLIDPIPVEAPITSPTALPTEPPLASAEVSGETPWRDAMAAWTRTQIQREPEPVPEGPDAEIDQELLECFSEEAADYFHNLLGMVEKLRIEPYDKGTIADIRVVFHTMKGSARTIGLDTFGEFMHDMEAVFNGLRDGYIQGSAEIAEFAGYVASQMGGYTGLIETRIPLQPADFDIPHTIAEAISEKRFSDNFTVHVVTVENSATDPLADSGADADEPVIPYSPDIWTHSLARQVLGAVTARLDESGNGATGIERDQARSLAAAVFPALLELRDAGLLEPGTENVALFLELPQIEQLASGAIYGLIETDDGAQKRLSLSDEAADALQDYLDEIRRTDSLVMLHCKAVSLLCAALSLDEVEPEEDESASSPAQGNVVDLRDANTHVDTEDIDDELLELFIETIDEYSESIDYAITGLASGEEAALRGLKNTLHTVKGAANSVGLRNLGALVHGLESQILDIESAGNVLAKKPIAAIDALVDDFNIATRFVSKHKQDWDETIAAAIDASAEDELETLPVEPGQDGIAANDSPGEQRSDSLRVETHRVDRLLDMGLEISMSNVRGRQSLDAASQDRAEVQSLARRVLTLVDQLSLQLDTEIQAKTEAMPDGAKFDPLEMDRMTEKQGLAAILREAAYDLQEESRGLGLHLDTALREAQSSGRLLQTNQSELRQLRLVNFSKLGPGFRRLVHQVSRQLGKQVEFDFDCGKGGLDIRVFEQLRIALEHMLRNAIDHGIGTPEQRRTQGKAECGNLKLSISRSGSEFTIRLLDDGRGMDPDRLRKQALELGMIQADDELSDEEALRLVLRAGFSTAEHVTDVSGRGVGMDAVYQSIAQVGGSVEIQSKPGFFTQFDIRVPTSIMVNEALLATIGEEQIAIPLTSLKGSGFLRRDDVHREAAVSTGRLSFRGEDYEVRYLGAVRGTRPTPSLGEMPDFVPVLFAQLKRRRVAFFADSLDTAEDMVIRALGSQYTGVPGIAGGAVKSDGQPVLALDLNEFIGQVDHADRLADTESTARDDSTLILCVDDSVMMRRTYEKRLESLGYKVVTAVDGEDALDYLSQAARAPDFIFSDLEMPNMNGFEFIANLRRVPELAHIPTVVVSSRDADKHRAEAQRVGASGFMAKGSNSAEAMQAVINEHLEAARTAMVS